MRKAALLYNPLCGRRRERPMSEVESALLELRNAGVEADASETLAPVHIADQVRRAIAEGCDTIFACGGDGTIHNVVQGIVSTKAALGIIPMGTANSLAHDLRLPQTAAGAARAALRATPRRIAVGHISCRDLSGNLVSRYFTVTAGIGLDACVFYKLSAKAKSRIGSAAYYAEAIKVWLTHPMDKFGVRFKPSEAQQTRETSLSQLLAVRIRDFGGLLRELAPGATLDRGDLRLVLFQTASQMKYLSYVLRGLLGANWRIPGIEVLGGEFAICDFTPGSSHDSHIYVQADGEFLGTLPAKISIVPDALTLLMP